MAKDKKVKEDVVVGDDLASLTVEEVEILDVEVGDDSSSLNTKEPEVLNKESEEVETVADGKASDTDTAIEKPEKIESFSQTEMDEVQDTAARVEEYFQLKDTLKTLRQDLKDHKESHLDWEELQEVTQKTKELRENIKNDEDIRIIQEKSEQVKERMDMLKEIIKVELIETEQIEIKKDGRKLKLVQVLKEMKDEEAALD